MSVSIRLRREGSLNNPYYKVVVADQRSPRDGKFIERLGSYDPMLPQEHKSRLVMHEERIKYWLGVGALPTDRVGRFLAKAGMMKPVERATQPEQTLPRVERKKIQAEKIAAKKVITDAAAATAKAAKEAPKAAPAA